MSGKFAKRHRKELFEEAGEAKREVLGFLTGAFGRVAGEYNRRARIIFAKFPGHARPCDTCAFRKSAYFVDGEDGFIVTALAFLRSLATGSEFACHVRTADGYEARVDPATGHKVPCVGWLMFQSNAPEPFDALKFWTQHERTTFALAQRIAEGEGLNKPK